MSSLDFASRRETLFKILKEEWCHPFMYTIVTIVALYGLAVMLASSTIGSVLTVTGALYPSPLRYSVVVFVIGFFLWRILAIMIFQRPRRLFRAIGHDLWHNYLANRRVIRALPVLILIPFFLSLFMTAKNMIPLIQPFVWDPAFAELDRVLHFGRQPWEWLHPLLGFSAATFAINFFYKMWFFAKFTVVLWQAFSLEDYRLRSHFFIAFLLTWIINGTLLATFLSSAGPCYFGLLHPDLMDPFAGLMSFLHELDENGTPVWALFAQNYLWEAFNKQEVGFLSGISAMPSMHVSIAFIFMLLGWRRSRGWGVFFTVFLLLTMIGSVHLGWHYAADGYVAIIVATGIWLFSGWFVRRFIPQLPETSSDFREG